MWYILLPQLIFRSPGKSSKKSNEIVIMRCVAFLNGNHGALLNKWEADRNKALLRPKRKRKPEKEKARLKRATDDILNARQNVRRLDVFLIDFLQVIESGFSENFIFCGFWSFPSTTNSEVANP
jgi:hypothetical protein